MAVPLGIPFPADQALLNPFLTHQNNQAAALISDLARLPERLRLPVVLNPHGSALLKIDSTENDTLRAFLRSELDLTRLNKMDKHLFFAGLERPCRPLHHQIILGREIWVCEQADLHMLWEESHIYIKPLPEFLLEYSVWEQHLCKDQSLHQNAKGFLLSYVWLITRKSDLRIAHDKGLIPTGIDWEHWIGFVEQIITNIDYQTLSDVNIRYRRGELRLYRVNWIYRLCSNTRKDSSFFRSYHYSNHTYSSFIARNLALLTAIIVYVALVLTAMQVGLATDELKDNDSFNTASYGFTVFSILAPLVVVGVILLLTAYLVVGNWVHAVEKSKTWPGQPQNHFIH